MSPVELPTMSTAIVGLDADQLRVLNEAAESLGSAGPYWKKTFEKFTAIPKDKKVAKVEILVGAIKEIAKKFPKDGDIAMRRAYYHLGYTLERIATFDERDEGENQRLFMSAAQCYVYSDMIFGMWTEYSLRAINCLSAAGDLEAAQNLSNQVYGPDGPTVIGDSTAKGKDFVERMRMTKYVQLDELGHRIYNIYLPNKDNS